MKDTSEMLKEKQKEETPFSDIADGAVVIITEFENDGGFLAEVKYKNGAKLGIRVPFTTKIPLIRIIEMYAKEYFRRRKLEGTLMNEKDALKEWQNMRKKMEEEKIEKPTEEVEEETVTETVEETVEEPKEEPVEEATKKVELVGIHPSATLDGLNFGDLVAKNDVKAAILKGIATSSDEHALQWLRLFLGE